MSSKMERVVAYVEDTNVLSPSPKVNPWTLLDRAEGGSRAEKEQCKEYFRHVASDRLVGKA